MGKAGFNTKISIKSLFELLKASGSSENLDQAFSETKHYQLKAFRVFKNIYLIKLGGDRRKQMKKSSHGFIIQFSLHPTLRLL